MWNFLSGLWYGFLSFLSLLLPFAKDSPWRRLGPGVWLVLHILLVGLIAVGLYFLDLRLVGRRIVPDLPDGFWLPVIFLLVYLLLWTAWWVYKLLMAEPEPSSFPDIDAAWEEAMRALAQAGIAPSTLPWFLVLGRPAAGEEHLFNAAQAPLKVKQTPLGPRVPVHVYATDSAVYITCAGASLLGRHAANVALDDIEDLGGAMAGGGAEPGGDQTIRPGGKEKKVIKRLVRIGGRAMNVIERRASRRELGLAMPDLLKSPAEVELGRARLAHLARLLVRERQPLCSINGLLVLLPIGGTDTEHDAQQTAEVCSRDLATLRQVLKLRCPLFVLGCDLEALPGVTDFIQRVPAKDRLGRLGQRFPLASPDLAGEKLHEQIDASIHHLCNSYLRDWIYRLFRGDAAAGHEAATANTGLYLFLDEMRARRKNFSRIVTQGIAKESPLPLLYGGCYLAATGADPAREQAFVAGVLRRLGENEDFVAWTDEAFAEDLRSHRRAKLGYTLLIAAGLAVAGLVVYLLFGRKET